MLDSVIWDWNGTLLDDVDVCVAAMNVLLGRRGLASLDRGRHQTLFRFPVQEYYEDLGFDFGTEPFSAVAAEYHEAYNAGVVAATLRGDALHTLDSFQQAGVRQLMLSALVEASLVRQVAAYGISGYFSAIFGLSDTHAVSKLERGRQLIVSESIDTRSSLVVGDTAHDAEVASALGVRCVLVASGHQSVDHLSESGCPVVESLADALSAAV